MTRRPVVFVPGFPASVLRDANVPFLSAKWLDAGEIRRFFVPAGFYAAKHGGVHSELFESRPVTRLLRRILREEPVTKMHLHAAFDSPSVATGAKKILVRLVAQDPDGNPLDGVRASFDLGFQQSRDEATWDTQGRGLLTWHRPVTAGGAAVPCALTFRWRDAGKVKFKRFELLIPR